jgi:sortase A
MRALAVGLIFLGALALIDVGVTLVWQEPISALYAKVRQDRLSGALR